MWLINTSTLALHFFTQPKVKYVILSHTWNLEELSFQEFQDLSSARTKQGFSKIQRTCDIALSEGIEWAWVDTCCIDKTSSAELSESINSMFAWYNNSEVCLAYLEDLTPDKSFDEGFANCRWPTRGWTLQELIAPKQLIFYDSAWVARTTKLASLDIIVRVTGVNEDVLEDSSHLGTTTVAQRMSWVSQRSTTRIEDMAYCMFGMFDLHMPLIYGEGDKAFMRLQEEIAKHTTDLSLFAWTADIPEGTPAEHHYRGILARSPHEFKHCGNLVQRNSLPSFKEFAITNRGLRIEATLVKLIGADPDELVFNLSLSYQHNGPYSKLTGNGWIGIYVKKTVDGFVRTFSHKLYESGRHSRMRQPKMLIYVRKDVSPAGIERLMSQYAGAIYLKSIPRGVKILQVQPKELWDPERLLFLDSGSGLNIYLVLQVPATSEHDRFSALIACSTMQSPTCIVWTEQDLEYGNAISFLGEAGEVTDFTAVDYLLRDMVPNARWGQLNSICKYVPHTDCEIVLQAIMKVTEVQDQGAFSIDLFMRTENWLSRSKPSILFHNEQE